jgi:hypothetical protein
LQSREKPTDANLEISRQLDAVPKKRGPKTDVLEALLKRVDGLEAKLKEKNAEAGSPTTPGTTGEATATSADGQSPTAAEPSNKRVAVDSNSSPSGGDVAIYSPDGAHARSAPHYWLGNLRHSD